MEDQVLILELQRLVYSVIAGGIIGFERAFQGRPAGFRTHILVCVASCLLMIMAGYQWSAVPAEHFDTVRIDPTRMAQGVMTGIGFLGAGVIMRQRGIVRGLTTAASIWITAAIGLVIGMGFYDLAALATLVTIGTLTVFNWLEKSLPTRAYAHLVLNFKKENTLMEAELKALLKTHRVHANAMSYTLDRNTGLFRYQFNISAFAQRHFTSLSVAMMDHQAIESFELTPISDG